MPLQFEFDCNSKLLIYKPPQSAFDQFGPRSIGFEKEMKKLLFVLSLAYERR